MDYAVSLSRHGFRRNDRVGPRRAKFACRLRGWQDGETGEQLETPGQLGIHDPGHVGLQQFHVETGLQLNELRAGIGFAG